MDYAAEDDTKPDPEAEKKKNSSDQVVARRFDYETEARCDQHMEAFKRSIAAASEAPGQGFAAIKVVCSLADHQCLRFVARCPWPSWPCGMNEHEAIWSAIAFRPGAYMKAFKYPLAAAAEASGHASAAIWCS